jgi:hypothetical protein
LSALLDGIEQPHVLNRDYRLISEGFDELDLLLSEWPYGSARQDKQANWSPLSQKRRPEDCAKVAKPCDFT